MSAPFYEVLKKIRLMHGHSLQNLADELGVSRTTYTRYENGEIEISYKDMLHVAEFYKMTLDELTHYGDLSYKVHESQMGSSKKFTVPVMVMLDGTEDTLEVWVKKLTAINAVI